jgi:lipopolysaccharide biosynthesis glycosyltransferase
MKQHKNCILLVCNKSYLNHALFLAFNLNNTKNINFEVVICSGEDLLDLIPDNIKFIQINPEEFTVNLPTIPRLQEYSYWRIPAIEVASHYYTKILYIDIDFYLNCKDISELFDIDMCGHMIGAVRDVHQITRPKRMPLEFKAANMKFVDYFNAGFLLIDSKLWRDSDAYSKISTISKKYIQILYCHDQSLLNLLIQGNWLELSPRWNWQFTPKNLFIMEFYSPKFIHFSGVEKFWDKNSKSIPIKYLENYCYYFGIDFKENTMTLSTNYKFIVLLKNLWYFFKYMKYLSKFEHPKSIINKIN